MSISLASCALDAERDVPDIERRAAALDETIMCPVCPGESIAQSQNELAAQMRDIVREKLTEGWTDESIRQFFVDRYGPSVLLEPPTEGFGLAAWIVPPAAFGMAVVSLLLTLRWMRMSNERERDEQSGDAERDRYLAKIDGAIGADSPPEEPPATRRGNRGGGGQA